MVLQKISLRVVAGCLRDWWPVRPLYAVLGHHLFGFIHPYIDGNGRTARFIMNTFLVTAGFPWIIIRVEDRDKYMQALESASVHSDIEPFAKFIERIIR